MKIKAVGYLGNISIDRQVAMSSEIHAPYPSHFEGWEGWGCFVLSNTKGIS